MNTISTIFGIIYTTWGLFAKYFDLPLLGMSGRLPQTQLLQSARGTLSRQLSVVLPPQSG